MSRSALLIFGFLNVNRPLSSPKVYIGGEARSFSMSHRLHRGKSLGPSCTSPYFLHTSSYFLPISSYLLLILPFIFETSKGSQILGYLFIYPTISLYFLHIFHIFLRIFHIFKSSPTHRLWDGKITGIGRGTWKNSESSRGEGREFLV